MASDKSLEKRTRELYKNEERCHSATNTYVEFCSHYGQPYCKQDCEYAKERNDKQTKNKI